METFKEFVRNVRKVLKVKEKYDLENTNNLVADNKSNYIIKPDGTPHNLTDNVKSVNGKKPTSNNTVSIPTISKIIEQNGNEIDITSVNQEVTLTYQPKQTFNIITGKARLAPDNNAVIVDEIPVNAEGFIWDTTSIYPIKKIDDTKAGYLSSYVVSDTVTAYIFNYDIQQTEYTEV